MQVIREWLSGPRRRLEQVSERLRREIAAHEVTSRQLAEAQHALETRVAERTRELRALEAEQRRLSEELGATLQRYETALRGSHVTVFTQDRDLRYTSISNPLLGLGVDEVVGRTDEEILPAASRAAVIALKREVLAGGAASDGEVSIAEGAGEHWFDLHVEPLRDRTGATVGVSCAAVDVTARKEGEAHLRLLLRELTHRSKNLLAVIQAIARQTARHTDTIERFIEQFGARLQALATSHDLLVQEGWHGAQLHQLIRSQLAQHLDGRAERVTVDGPAVALRPEAAQSLGLALHELVSNALRYGALSDARGRVSVTWRLREPSEGGGLEILWAEQGGPPVTSPQRSGLGRLVIERNLPRALDGEAELTFDPAGARFRVLVPDAQILGLR